MIVAQTGLAARATWEGRRLHSAAHLIVLMALRHCRHAGLVLGRAVGRLPAYGAFGVCIQEVALSRRLVHDGRQGQEGDEGCPRGDAHLLSLRRCIWGRSRSDARPFFFRGMRPLSKSSVETSKCSVTMICENYSIGPHRVTTTRNRRIQFFFQVMDQIGRVKNRRLIHANVFRTCVTAI
jgi:hypothetical protein